MNGGKEVKIRLFTVILILVFAVVTGNSVYASGAGEDGTPLMRAVTLGHTEEVLRLILKLCRERIPPDNIS
jgi:hypothetical protein